MRPYHRGPRLDSTRLGSASPTLAPAASRLSAALALPAKVHACILCGVHRIRCISKSRRNKSQKYRSRGTANTVRARPRKSSQILCVKPIPSRARARYRSPKGRISPEREPGEIRRERRKKKEREQSVTKGERAEVE